MNLRRVATYASLSVLTAVGSVVATGSAASAAPTGCTVTYGSNWAQSICTGGTGEHQVNMLQKHFMPGVGYIACPGNWAAVGQVSYAACANHTIVDVWVNTRG
ncbi:hypothetical protein ACFQY4_19420 [Catellatospora bangladeshensis]|uniref:Secreted protein n=1 Tax=Catellatospora bangladeshensis TaxID=310355 RepID=A0A8J3JHD0_9ACTN|nr:hypothetical protein [Catellatospora bangladeshensis]GIF84636.1 hypothetical protein Cba03nite_59850 [Catellatospora bangladeshensis]